jgi:hypothetical protein
MKNAHIHFYLTGVFIGEVGVKPRRGLRAAQGKSKGLLKKTTS